MPSVEANGITIEYEEQGLGDPLLMIMGWGAQLIDWPQGLVDILSESGFRVIRFDNRDAGLSSEFDWEPPSMTKAFVQGSLKRPVDVGYDLSDMADDAAGLLGVLGVDSAHVVGASMGGMIAQTMAIEHPDRVRSLTSIMSNTGDRKNGRIATKLIPKLLKHKPTRESAPVESSALFELFAGPHFDPQASFDRCTARTNRSWRPSGSARQLAAIAASGDRTKKLRNLNVATTIIHGLADPLVLPSGGIATAKAIPGSQLLMFNDMGHDLPEPRWEDISCAIRMQADRADHANLHSVEV